MPAGLDKMRFLYPVEGSASIWSRGRAAGQSTHRRSLETAEVESTGASSDDSDLCSVTQLNEHLLQGELDAP